MAQHDYVLSNQSGASFRSDLNNALSAIVSQNSGAAEPSTTYAYQTWADTTNGVMKLRNGANSAWITLYQLDGEWSTIAFENGSAAAPSIYFKDSGTDTGFYSSGTDAVDISTGGTRRLGVASSGDVTVYGGNVTLNGQGDLRLADSDSSNWIAFQAPSTVASNVTYTLPSADGTANYVLATNGSGTLSWNAPGGTEIATGNTSATVVDTGSDGHFKVTTEGTERLRVNAAGNVGIGTNSPSSVLELKHSSAADIRLTVGSTLVGNIYGSASDLNFHAVANVPILFNTNNTEQMRLDSAGNLKFNSGFGSVATAYGCRAWVNFQGTSTVTVRGSGNISSVSDNGVGNYTLNFTDAMSDTNYTGSAMSSSGTGTCPLMGNRNTGSCVITTVNASGAATDYGTVCVTIFR